MGVEARLRTVDLEARLRTVDLEARLKARAAELGFPLAGIAPATEADSFAHYRRWLDRGFAGEMTYLHTQAEARRHPSSILENVRSVVMLGLEYGDPPADPLVRDGPGGATPVDSRGSEAPAGASAAAPAGSSGRATNARSAERTFARVARYAAGPDYHRFVWDRLNRLAEWLEAELPGCHTAAVADTAPLLERDFARRAGLGWIGKNTMLIHPRRGSYFFLAALLVDRELHPDAPFAGSHCGTCTACLDACPTAAFPEPSVLDATRCISYLTIEHRSSIPVELREAIGDWLWGCDVCQEVCPWNRKPSPGPVAFPRTPDLLRLDPVELLGLDAERFRQRFKKTALWRNRRAGLLRNAAIVLGNVGNADALPALEKALDDPEPLVREAAAWAIERIRERNRQRVGDATPQPVTVPSTDSRC